MCADKTIQRWRAAYQRSSRKIVMPEIIGGNTRRTARGGINEMAIVVKHATMITPISRPCTKTRPA
jgi:hypothetical protein